MPQYRTRSSISKFYFMDLPAELQKMVFEKYYEGDRSFELKLRGRTTIRPYRVASPVSAPIPVSRYFYEEMKKVFISSHRGTLSIVSLPKLDVFSVCQLFDDTITAVAVTYDSMYSATSILETCKARFKKLKVIEIRNGVWDLDCDWMYRELEKVDLLKFIKGKKEVDLSKECHKFVKKQFMKGFVLHGCRVNIEALGETTIRWTGTSFRNPCPCPVERCVVRYAMLDVELNISVDEFRCKLREFWGPSSSSLEEAMKHLRSQKAVSE